MEKKSYFSENIGSKEEVEDLFAYLPPSTPRLRPHQTIAHLYNAMTQGDFSALFDSTLREIAVLNADIFSIATDSRTKITVFDNSLVAFFESPYLNSPVFAA